MPQFPLYEEILHDYDAFEYWHPLGIILDQVITDEEVRYDFFGKSHRVADSGYSYMYLNDSLIVPDTDNNEEYAWLNTHMILDYEPETVFFDDFESYTNSTTSGITDVFPSSGGWTFIQKVVNWSDSDYPNGIYRGYRHSGSYSFNLRGRSIIGFPDINLPEGVGYEDLTIEMYLRQPNSIYRLQLGIWDGSNFTTLYTFNNSSTSIEYVRWDFSNYDGTIPSGRLAFRNTISSGSITYSYNYIDDVRITLTPEASLGTHIGNQDDPTYYQWGLEDVINRIDNGDIIRFAVLFNLYYYYDLQQYASWTNFNFDNVWADAVTWYSERTENPAIFPVIDIEDYIQVDLDYHPGFTMSHPGAVYECFRDCPASETYTIRSCNGKDHHNVYTGISRDLLESILRGNPYGLYQIGAPGNVGNTTSLFGSVPYTAPQWPWHEYHYDTNYTNMSGKEHMNEEEYYHNIYIDPDSGDEIDLFSESADTFMNYPVFVTVAGHIYKPQEISDIGPTIADIPDIDYNTSILKPIFISWDDDTCRAFRPESVTVELYILRDNKAYFYQSLDISREQHRENEYVWKRNTTIPIQYSDSTYISWGLIVKPINYGSPSYTTGNPYTVLLPPPGQTVEGVAYGTVAWNADTYVEFQLTNTSGISSSIPVTFRKVWGYVDCSNCHQSVDVAISGEGYTITDYLTPLVVNIGWSKINPDLTNDIHEQEIEGYYGVILHSDNCLEWTFYNFPIEYPDVIPIDNSGVGNLFYFEIDQECINHVGSSVVGFRVKGGWGKYKGKHPIYHGWDGRLCYKWVEHESNFEHYVSGSQEYYEFIRTGWRPYYEGAGVEQAVICQDTGQNPWDPVMFGSTSHTTVGKDHMVHGRSVYDGVIAPLPQKGKVRLYIGTCQVHHQRLSSLGKGFEAATLINDDDELSYNENNVNASPDQYNLPLRIGGDLGALYGITDDMLLNYSLNHDYKWIDDGANWYTIRTRLYNTHDSNSSGWGGLGTGDIGVRDQVYNCHCAGAHGSEIMSDIHDGLEFNFPTSWSYPKRWLLYDADDISNYFDNPNGVGSNLLTEAFFVSPVAFVMCVCYAVYGVPDSPGEQINQTYDSDDVEGTWGDLFDRLFIHMRNVVDASQLEILPPMVDMQYHRTFMDSGLGNTVVSPVGGFGNSRYMPYCRSLLSIDNVFAPFKDMYRNCTDYVYTIYDDVLINKGQKPGMHYYDSMFKGSSISGIDFDIEPANKVAPWGMCRGMFSRCKRIVSISGTLLDDLMGMGPGAFMAMFRDSSTIPFRIPPCDVSDIGFCDMYRNAQGPSSYHNDFCHLPTVKAEDGSYARMFMGSKDYWKIELANDNEYKEWTFTQMMRGSDVRVINLSKMKRWDKRAYAFRNWVYNIYGANITTNPSSGDREFMKLRRLNKIRNRDRIPRKAKKWLVTNIG